MDKVSFHCPIIMGSFCNGEYRNWKYHTNSLLIFKTQQNDKNSTFLPEGRSLPYFIAETPITQITKTENI